MKCQKSAKNAHPKFPEPNVISIYFQLIDYSINPCSSK